MPNRRRTRLRKTGAALSDGVQLPSQDIRAASVPFTLQAFAQSGSDRIRPGLAGQLRQLSHQSAGLGRNTDSGWVSATPELSVLGSHASRLVKYPRS